MYMYIVSYYYCTCTLSNNHILVNKLLLTFSTSYSHYCLKSNISSQVSSVHYNTCITNSIIHVHVHVQSTTVDDVLYKIPKIFFHSSCNILFCVMEITIITNLSRWKFGNGCYDNNNNNRKPYSTIWTGPIMCLQWNRRPSEKRTKL